MRRPILSNKGMSLVELLVGVGIGAIMMSMFASMITNQNLEAKALREKLASMDLERVLIDALGDGSTCLYVLSTPSPLTFDSSNISATAPPSLSPTLPLYARVKNNVPGPVVAQVSQLASSFSDSLIVKSIRLEVLSGSSQSYVGRWVVDFDETKTVRAIKPVSVSVILNVDDSSPSASKVLGCSSAGGGGSSVWRGYEDLKGKVIDTGQLVDSNASPCSWIRVGAKVTSDGMPMMRWQAQTGLNCTIVVDSGWQPGETLGGRATLSPGGLTLQSNTAMANLTTSTFPWP